MKVVLRALNIILPLLLAQSLSAQVVEEGSLRAFLLGNEPNTAYDNWLSHTVEGLSRAGGYNDYIPSAIDTQRNDFGDYVRILEAEDQNAREFWVPVFTALLNGNPTTAQQLLASTNFPFEVVDFRDSETERSYYMIREELDFSFVDPGLTPDSTFDDIIGSFRYGWGLYIVNPEASLSSVMLQVPHPNDDYISAPLATQMFLQGDMGALIINGTGREVAWEGAYNNGRSLSDPTRYPVHPFNYFCEAFVLFHRNQGNHDLSVQIHSYDTASHPGRMPIQISPGPEDSYPNRPIYDRSQNGLDWINFTRAVAVPENSLFDGQAAVPVEEYYAVWRGGGLLYLDHNADISSNVDLPGTSDNVPMMIAMRDAYSAASWDHFLHVEFDELPQVIEDAGVLEDSLYGSSIPPDETTWTSILAYYDASIDGLCDVLNDMYHGVDSDPPSNPSFVSDTYVSDRFADLAWFQSVDPNFATYEVYFDTLAITTESPKYDANQDITLADMFTSDVRIQPLIPGKTYFSAVRAVDLAGNVSEMVQGPVFLARDESDPFILRSAGLYTYPIGALPLPLRCSVRSIEPLDYIEAVLSINFGPEFSIPLVPEVPWAEGLTTTYLMPTNQPAFSVQPGDMIHYHYRTHDSSLWTNEVRSPAAGDIECQIVTGLHIYEAALEQNNGGMTPRGDLVWNWGVPSGGPGSGADGENAWSALDASPGTSGILELPGPINISGYDNVYLVFDAWFNTYETGYMNRVTAGGIIEYVNGDPLQEWRPLIPLSGYPARFEENPDEYGSCFGGDSDGWRQVVCIFTNALYDSLHLRLRFYSLESDPGSIGWAMDNLRLTSQPPTLSPPEDLSISVYATNSLRLSWTPNGAASYRVYRGDSPYGPMEEVAEVYGSSWIDSGVLSSDKTSSYYRVTAILR